jgi:hypothetical protein
VALELGEVGVDAPHEHARVPQVVPGRDVLDRRDLVGLLDERAELVAGADRGAEPQVAETGVRARGGDADGHEQARGGQLHGLGDGLREGFAVEHEVVGGEGAHDRGRVALGDDGGGEADGGGRVARRGLDEDVVAGDLGQLAGHVDGVGRARDDVDVVRVGQQSRPLDGRLQQRRVRAGERQQELGSLRARQGPEPSSGSACGDHRVKHANSLACRSHVPVHHLRRALRSDTAVAGV